MFQVPCIFYLRAKSSGNLNFKLRTHRNWSVGGEILGGGQNLDFWVKIQTFGPHKETIGVDEKQLAGI